MTTKVEGGAGALISLNRGEGLRIVNTHGNQVVDTWALGVSDTSEYMSMEHTRRLLGKLFPTANDELVSNRRNPMLRIETDSAGGIHDTLCAACDPWLYEFYGSEPGHANCSDNFQSALRRQQIASQPTPSPLNIWMNVVVDADNRMDLLAPTSGMGDEIVLRALMDVHVIISACPMDVTPVNGDGLTAVDIAYEVIA